MTPGLVVVPPISALSQEGNLLVTGVNMFCIFNPRKSLQMESCHPGKCVCDLCPPLAESEWWKKKLSPSGKPAARLSISLHIHPTAESLCTNSAQHTCRNVGSLISVPNCCICPSAIWVFDVTWIAAGFYFKLPWVEEVCQLPANNVSPLVEFVKNFKGAGVDQTQFLWELSIHQTKTRNTQKTCDVQEAREAVSEAEEMRPVCKSLWMAWILPTSDLLLIPLFAC